MPDEHVGEDAFGFGDENQGARQAFFDRYSPSYVELKQRLADTQAELDRVGAARDAENSSHRGERARLRQQIDRMEDAARMMRIGVGPEGSATAVNDSSTEAEL